MSIIIGRNEEKAILSELYQSNQAEFLAIYGRRRIGKTYLIYNYFKDKGLYFEITGSKDAAMEEQLVYFNREFRALFQMASSSIVPKSWSEALYQLFLAIEKLQTKQKIILFFDEIPWLASHKSDFLTALDYYWNRHFSRMSNILLIICGSAASWMIGKVINNKGGLHGRLSAQIQLQPFKLSETEEFFKRKKIELSKKQIAEIFMVTGGVAKYLALVKRGQSSAQTINKLCFTPQSSLLTEFHKLYDSLFNDYQKHLEIVKALSAKRHGLTQKELFSITQLPQGGRTLEIIRELEESGFLLSILDFGKKSRDKKYILADEYSLFYLKWIDDVKSTILQGTETNYWEKIQMSPSWNSWAGYTFESICYKHIFKIKQALGIAGISTKQSHWKCPCAEVDLVIDRADQCINLCEIKFYKSVYEVTANDRENIERKKQMFIQTTKTKKTVFVTLISCYGANESANYRQCIDNQITLEELF